MARRGMVPRGGEDAEARQKWRGKRGKGKGGEDEAEVGERAEGGGGSQEARAWKRGSSRRARKMETADPSGRAEGAPRDDSYERWSLGLQKRTKAATLTPSERAAPLDDGRAFSPPVRDCSEQRRRGVEGWWLRAEKRQRFTHGEGARWVG